MKMYFRMNKVARMYDIVRNVVIPALYSRWAEILMKLDILPSCTHRYESKDYLEIFRMYADVAPDDLFNLLY